MGELVTYVRHGDAATVAMDDGKVNALSPSMQSALHAAFDRAEADGVVVVLTGRPGVFSAGFDLGVLRAGGDEASEMVRGGFELAARVLSFPRPVVVASPGHAIAMGLFLLLSGDARIGASGGSTLVANEVAIGLTMPYAAIELLRLRLAPAVLDRAVGLAAPFSPEEAVEAGILHQVVPAAELPRAAADAAARAAQLDQRAHAASKLRVRERALADLRQALVRDGLVP